MRRELISDMSISAELFGESENSNLEELLDLNLSHNSLFTALPAYTGDALLYPQGSSQYFIA